MGFAFFTTVKYYEEKSIDMYTIKENEIDFTADYQLRINRQVSDF
jgi:hypothetical protein